MTVHTKHISMQHIKNIKPMFIFLKLGIFSISTHKMRNNLNLNLMKIKQLKC